MPLRYQVFDAMNIAKAATVKLPEIFTIGSAAKYYGVNERTLRRWIAKGKIPRPRQATCVITKKPTLKVWTRAELDEFSVNALIAQPHAVCSA